MAEYPAKDIVAFLTDDFTLVHVHHSDKGVIHINDVKISIYYAHPISSDLEDEVEFRSAFKQRNFSIFSLGDITGGGKGTNHVSSLVFID